MTSPLIILDSNVVSELVRPHPEPVVVEWYTRQDSSLLCTTAVSVAEIFFGLNMMPHGKRRERLIDLSRAVFSEGLQGNVLAFNNIAAEHYAHLRALRQLRGRPMAELDAQIAAITSANNALLATRNTAVFEHCGISLINPWLA